MSINAYTGLQGSGKSYETISTPIMDAIAHGRRVVTNVDGVNEEKIHEYLIDKHKLDPAALGSVIHVQNDDIAKPGFFPDEEKPDIISIVLAGDLVAIDEAWRFWGEGTKLTHEHMQFFRMHRHYIHPTTGVACDVVLMTQDITGLTRALKNVIEFSFKMHKLKSLGLSKGYRIELYEGWKQNSKTRIDTYIKKYDPAIFLLYKSYSGGEGTEKTIDKRQNILANKKVWFIVIGVIVLFIFTARQTWLFFHPKPKPGNEKSLKFSGDIKSVGMAANTPAGVVTSPASSGVVRQVFSEMWRVTGRYEVNGVAWMVLSDAAGRLRVESPSVFSNAGVATVGTGNGETVTAWSGSVPSSSPIETKK
ncbi:zonular occludens toxin domain-containing protein [Undibacterium sp. SXout20W]|uniref:zonular occludens toxin domain-containing protein n=1 Tax=Undibacterium sp. SXout20W TaxID=3413051 RepID=UPI003BF401B4